MSAETDFVSNTPDSEVPSIQKKNFERKRARSNSKKCGMPTTFSRVSKLSCNRFGLAIRFEFFKMELRAFFKYHHHIGNEMCTLQTSALALATYEQRQPRAHPMDE